ncbi:hypothetical protein D0Y65_039627, partial [Glycine soja]
ADQGQVADGILHDVDLSEPTMGEKLAALSLPDKNKFRRDKEQDSSDPTKPPSADSVHVLLGQALNADGRTLLLDCLYTQDEKVITKSIAQLNPSNVLKFLHPLISINESSPPNQSQKNDDLKPVHRWIVVKFEYHVRNTIPSILTVGNFDIVSELREKPFAL